MRECHQRRLAGQGDPDRCRATFVVGLDGDRKHSIAAGLDVHALESWSWPDLAGKMPVLTSLFGDVVLESGDGYWFLDTVQGKLTRAWSNQDDLRAAFADPEMREQYLLEGLAVAAAQNGIALAPEQIYDFSTPPVLGGDLGVENLSAADFQVALNIAGQIHEQVRNLPPGTPISQIKISPPE